MAYACRPKTGAQEYKNKKLREDGAAYRINFKETGENAERRCLLT